MLLRNLGFVDIFLLLLEEFLVGEQIGFSVGVLGWVHVLLCEHIHVETRGQPQVSS